MFNTNIDFLFTILRYLCQFSVFIKTIFYDLQELCFEILLFIIIN